MLLQEIISTLLWPQITGVKMCITSAPGIDFLDILRA
jgi:hypothetical protein